MADTARPFEAYRGDGSFIFVSYAHEDAAIVYPDLEVLREAGFNVYYDEGISPGSRWTTELANAIERCDLFLVFLSPSAVASQNCTNEIEFAVSRRRPMLAVHTVSTDLPSGLEFSLGARQALMKSELPQGAYRTRLVEAVGTLIAGAEPSDASAVPFPQRSSRIRRGLLVAFVVAVAAMLYLAIRSGSQSSHVVADLRPAVAVRPFDTTAAASSDFFADGIADDLIIRLGRWRTLPVIARGSSFASDLPRDPMAVGRALDARYVLEGSVRTIGDRLQIDVYLIDAEDGRALWSREFEEQLDAVLAAQTDLADAIVARINPALMTAETQRAVRADPSNLDAWSAAMRGWWHLNTESRDGLEEAQAWFRRAIEKDPAWSWPEAALALSGYRALVSGWADDRQATVSMMIEAANRAVQLGAQDAFAHHALGHAYAIQGQIEPALLALERGVELAPNDPMANGCYAMQLAASARSAKALSVVDHATAISPEDPWLHWFALVRARAHFAAADYEAAEDWALRSLQLKPTSGAKLHSIAAPAMGDGLPRARQRAQDMQNQRPLPPLASIETSFRRNTDADYVARLVEGLRRAGFE